MLTITVPASEKWDELNEVFINTKEQTLQLEHSLMSVSKWESKWHKPFLVKSPPKTEEEAIDYIRCMTLTQNVNPEIYYNLTDENILKVNKYIEDPMTASVVPKSNKAPSRETITSELIYYWMIQCNIPVEFQKWHLNRLLTLIEVCNFKNTPPTKLSKTELLRRNKSLNAARREQLHTKG